MTNELFEGFEEAEQSIITLIETETAFGQIEDYIDSLLLDDEHKSVLWLLAWSELPWQHRRKILKGV